MLKLVIDTNVVISSLLKPESNPAFVLSLILEGVCKLCLTEKIFTEYEEVLGRGKFKNLETASVSAFLLKLRSKAFWVVPKVTIDDVAKDPGDNTLGLRQIYG